MRNFAQIQRDSMKDVEVETLQGVILGHKHIPVNAVGCYVPGGKYPLIASAHMSVVTAKVVYIPRVIASAPAFEEQTSSCNCCSHGYGRCDEIYTVGGVQAVGMMAIGTSVSLLLM